LAKKIKNKPKKKGLFNRGLFNLAAAVVITVCAALIITTIRDCSQKEKELTRIQAKIDAYKIENEDMQRTLEGDDLSAYMEKIALERGYAYPNERRFYDTSRD
jgi:cell division protein FtsL